MDSDRPAIPDTSTARVRRRFRSLINNGARLRPAGAARSNPDALLDAYMPRCSVELFGTTFFLTRYLYDEALNFFVGYVVHGVDDKDPGVSIYPRIFYKDSSLVWRVASHFVHDPLEYWIGKGDVRTIRVDDEEYVCSVEETTNLPYELQHAFDLCSRAGKSKRDDDAVELVLRRAPSGRIAPYADFTAPRRNAGTRINRGRPVARFTKPGDPTSLRFTSGFEPDLRAGLADSWVTGSRFFGGELRKYRVLSTNRRIQYLFFASPTHAWLNPPQALTTELSSYGVRLVDVHADDDLFVPGFEYHEEEADGTVTHSQIPAGFAGAPHPDDPHRHDASMWVEALPIIQEFRRRFL